MPVTEFEPRYGRRHHSESSVEDGSVVSSDSEGEVVSPVPRNKNTFAHFTVQDRHVSKDNYFYLDLFLFQT